MQKKQMVKGLPNFREVIGVCEVSNIGKQHRDKIPRKVIGKYKKLESVHTNLCDPIIPIFIVVRDIC